MFLYQNIIINFSVNFFINFDYFFFNLYTNALQLLVITNIIYFLGIFGILYNKRNFLLTMLFIEVMYIGIFVYILTSSLLLNLPIGQIYALSLLIIAACESAIGLGILLILFKNDNTIKLENFTELRG
jgi:NADH-quinone oxidoreductase subunit K